MCRACLSNTAHTLACRRGPHSLMLCCGRGCPGPVTLAAASQCAAAGSQCAAAASQCAAAGSQCAAAGSAVFAAAAAGSAATQLGLLAHLAGTLQASKKSRSAFKGLFSFLGSLHVHATRNCMCTYTLSTLCSFCCVRS